MAVDGWAVSLHLVQRGGTERGRSSPRPVLAIPNVTAHPSTASVPITVLLYDGPLLCGFIVAIKTTRRAAHCVGYRSHTYSCFSSGNDAQFDGKASEVDFYPAVLDGILFNRFAASLWVCPDQSVAVRVVSVSRWYNLNWKRRSWTNTTIRSLIVIVIIYIIYVGGLA